MVVVSSVTDGDNSAAQQQTQKHQVDTDINAEYTLRNECGRGKQTQSSKHFAIASSVELSIVGGQHKGIRWRLSRRYDGGQIRMPGKGHGVAWRE